VPASERCAAELRRPGPTVGGTGYLPVLSHEITGKRKGSTAQEMATEALKTHKGIDILPK